MTWVWHRQSTSEKKDTSYAMNLTNRWARNIQYELGKEGWLTLTSWVCVSKWRGEPIQNDAGMVRVRGGQQQQQSGSSPFLCSSV